MTVEDRLRTALREDIEHVEPDPAMWDRVQRTVARTRRARRARNGLLAAAAVVLAVVAGATLVDRDDARVQTVPAHPGTTTPSTTTTASTATMAPATPAADVTSAIWPFTTQEQLDAYEANPGAGMFFDAEATALEFARTYLGMPDPVRDPADRTDVAAKDRTTIVVRPKPASRITTAIAVQLFDGPDGPWSVIGASTDDIVVDQPGANVTIQSPVHVAGRSIAFEAVVRVEVREDGQVFGQSLGASTVMGGGTEMAPFAGDIDFAPLAARRGAVVFFTDSAEDGSIVQATVVRVSLS